MRTFRLVLPALIVALALAGSADAGERGFGLADWMKGESQWKGHGVGSYYVEVTEVKMPSMPNMPNVPGMPKDGIMRTTVKTTLVKIEPTQYVLSVETTQMGRKTTSERRVPKVLRPNVDMKSKVTPAGQGPVVVEGKTHTCNKFKVANFADLSNESTTPEDPRGGGAVNSTFGPAFVWVHPDPKIGVLKMQTTISLMGRTHEMTWLTTKLSLSRSVGGHTFEAREITMSGAMGTKIVQEHAPAFPGGTLSSTSTSNMMGMSSKSTTRVTEYVKKPVGVVTGK